MREAIWKVIYINIYIYIYIYIYIHINSKKKRGHKIVPTHRVGTFQMTCWRNYKFGYRRGNFCRFLDINLLILSIYIWKFHFLYVVHGTAFTTILHSIGIYILK